MTDDAHHTNLRRRITVEARSFTHRAAPLWTLVAEILGCTKTDAINKCQALGWHPEGKAYDIVLGKKH